eukprot:954405_1
MHKLSDVLSIISDLTETNTAHQHTLIGVMVHDIITELYMDKKLDYFADFVASRHRDEMVQYITAMQTFYDNHDEQALFRSGFERNDLNTTKMNEIHLDNWYFTLQPHTQSYHVFQTTFDSSSDSTHQI